MTMPLPAAATQPERDKAPVPSAREALDSARRLGPRRTIARAAYLMTNRLVPVSIFECFELRPDDVNLALADAAGGYESRFLEAEEVRGSLEAVDPVGRHVALGAVAREDPCYAVLAGGRPVSFGFYARRPTPVLNDLVVHFRPPRWYMYGGFTVAEHRGRRLHALGILRAALELFESDVPALVTVCERTNYKATVSTLRMGWRPCGTLGRIGAGRRMRLSRSAEARAAGMWLGLRAADARP